MKAEIFYRALLFLYPKTFRLRFEQEMLQLFRDCYPASRRGVFWVLTLMDLACSVPREWRREIHREDSEIDYTGLADAISICCVVGTLLLSWGWTGATIALGLKAASGPAARNPGTVFLVASVTLALAILVGVLSALAAARPGRIETLCSQPVSYEKPLARFSR